MGKVNKETLFNVVEIRDTSSHTGVMQNLHDFQLKTIIIENNHNQAVTLQCRASAHDDFSASFDVGPSFEVPANTVTYQTCDSFFPFMNLVASYATAPTSGNLTVHFVEYGV